MPKQKTAPSAVTGRRKNPVRQKQVNQTKPPPLLSLRLHDLDVVNNLAVTLGLESKPGQVTDLRDGLTRIFGRYRKPSILPVHRFYHREVDANLKVPNYAALTGPKLAALAVDLIVDYANTEKANRLATDSPIPSKSKANLSVTPSPTKARQPKTPRKNQRQPEEGVKRQIK